jgi:hypothetical protein
VVADVGHALVVELDRKAGVAGIAAAVGALRAARAAVAVAGVREADAKVRQEVVVHGQHAMCRAADPRRSILGVLPKSWWALWPHMRNAASQSAIFRPVARLYSLNCESCG